jgi:hypothetical protein
MNRRSLILSSLAVALLGFAYAHAEDPEEQAEAGWVSLFNGRDLTGWTPKITGYPLGENFADTFRVRDGVLAVDYAGYEQFDNRFGHLFYEQPFSHYRLQLEYRFLGEQVPGGPGWAIRNSGVMFHCPDPKTMRLDQEFPVSLEAQVLGGDGQHPRTTGNVCTPGTHLHLEGQKVTRHCTSAHSETFHGPQWVQLEIEVHGDRLVRHKINGQVVLEYTQLELDPMDPDARRLLDSGAPLSVGSGLIALQSESHPVEFRAIRVMELDPASDTQSP